MVQSRSEICFLSPYFINTGSDIIHIAVDSSSQAKTRLLDDCDIIYDEIKTRNIFLWIFGYPLVAQVPSVASTPIVCPLVRPVSDLTAASEPASIIPKTFMSNSQNSRGIFDKIEPKGSRSITGNGNCFHRLFIGFFPGVGGGIIICSTQKEPHILDDKFSQEIAFSFGIVSTVRHVGFIPQVNKIFRAKIRDTVFTALKGFVIEFIKS